MNLDEYQAAVMRGATLDKTPLIHVLGLCGEAGEVADLFKKAHRNDQMRMTVDAGEVLLELGDVLWYLTALAAYFGASIEELAGLNYDKLSKRYPELYPPLSDRELVNDS